MLSRRSWLGMILLTACAVTAVAQDPANSVDAQLFSPEALIRHSREIGLTHEQVERVRTRLEEAAPQARKLQARLLEATRNLAGSLSADRVDEQAALKRLDEMLAIEQQQRRLHLRTMVRIRNELTAKQRRLAARILKAPESTPVIARRLKAKLSRVEREMQLRAEASRPPTEAGELMQKLPGLMQDGRIKEAEALLDRVLAVLRRDETGDAAKGHPGETGPATAPPTAPAPIGSLSPAEVRTGVDGLRKQDVAWRKIAWKTCLLDGLNASREQKKPILLWIFIDRPIDDERC